MPDAVLQKIKIKSTNTQTHTDIRVWAVQFCEARSLQKPFPLGCRMTSRGFDSWRCRSVGKRQRTGCPPSHVGTKLICIEPHIRESFRKSEGKVLWMNLKNGSSYDSLHSHYWVISWNLHWLWCRLNRRLFVVCLNGSWSERMQWILRQRIEFFEIHPKVKKVRKDELSWFEGVV